MATPSSDRLTVLSVLRLGLFQGCLGCLAVIFAGLFNRVMITELNVPGLVVGGALAFEQFVAPSRVLFGQISDAHPLVRRHRSPYVLIGTALFCSLAVASVPVIFTVSGVLADGAPAFQRLAAIGGLCGLFALYGLAISMASTPYLALVIDRTQESERPRAVAIIWCMLTVGIIVGAIAISISLRSLDGVSDPAVLEPTLQRFMVRVAAIVMALTVLALWGMERPTSPDRLRSSGSTPAPAPSASEESVTLRQSWALITSSRQVLIFFSFLILFTLGLFLQDPVLESYGAQVFGMPIAATAQLNAFWATGTLTGLLLAGLLIVPRLGKLPTARLGCRLIAASLLLLMACGATRSVALLQLVMVLFGLASGIGTNSALCLMLDLTLPQAAGTFVGVWGLAQALSRALGKILGGGLYDLGRLLPFGDVPLTPFLLVFGVELLIALSALVLLDRVNLGQFRQDTGRSLQKVLAMELG